MKKQSYFILSALVLTAMITKSSITAEGQFALDMHDNPITFSNKSTLDHLKAAATSGYKDMSSGYTSMMQKMNSAKEYVTPRLNVMGIAISDKLKDMKSQFQKDGAEIDKWADNNPGKAAGIYSVLISLGLGYYYRDYLLEKFKKLRAHLFGDTNSAQENNRTEAKMLELENKINALNAMIEIKNNPQEEMLAFQRTPDIALVETQYS